MTTDTKSTILPGALYFARKLTSFVLTPTTGEDYFSLRAFITYHRSEMDLVSE